MFTLLIVIIVFAFIFDYINGFHDSANAIATIVSTKVLTPFQAVLWAGFFNFVSYFISRFVFHEFGIGNTVAKWVNEDFITLEVLLIGVLAAILWNLITWWAGLPSSSSHTLMGGFIGAAIAHAGGFSNGIHDVINYSKVIPTFLFIFIAPFIGMVIAIFLTLIIVNICKGSNPFKVEKWFKRLQLVSSAAFSIGHGSNDAQKVMGIIGAAFIFYHTTPISGGGDPLLEYINANPDDRFNIFADHYWWVPLMSHLAIGLGTLSGGWRIVKTMGTRITKVTPLEGVAAETAGAFTLFLTEFLKIPVSTTHTITGSIVGVGLTKRVSAVRWGVTIKMLWAWIITIPISAVIAAVIFYGYHFITKIL